jgi:hypothetical protein
MAAHLGELGLASSFWDAVDGESMPEALAAMRPSERGPFGTPLRRSEIALAASFRGVCLEVADGPDDFACILEDDARLVRSTLDLLSEECLRRLPRFDVLRFGHSGLMPRQGAIRIGHVAGIAIVAPVAHGFSSHAQIVSRQGARRIAAGLVPLTAPIDWQLYDGSVVRLRILETIRSVASYDDGFASTIQVAGGAPDAARFDAEKRARRDARRRAKQHFRAEWGLWAYARARAFRKWRWPRSISDPMTHGASPEGEREARPAGSRG